MNRLFRDRNWLGGLLAVALVAVGFGGSGVANAQGLAAGLAPSKKTVTSINQNGVKQLTGQSSQPSQTHGTRTKLSAEQIAENLKYSTCFIVFVRQGKFRSTGTGWVVDAENRLIVTNHHVIDGNGPPDALLVYFPVKDTDGEWITDVKHYLKSVKPSKGTIVTSTKQHDLALVQLDTLPADVKALPLAKKSARSLSDLYSLGGMPAGSQMMWIPTSGKARQVGNRRNALGKISRMVECQLAVNKGNSGGPIVNEFGEIVAVCEGANFIENGLPVHNVTYHVDVKPLRTWLAGALPLVNPTTAFGFHDRGVRHLNVSRTAAAIADFSAAIRLDRNFAKSYSQRGWAFHLKGDHRTALADFDQAVALDASNANAYNGRGRTHRSLKQYDAAIRDFSNAIRFEPGNGTHYNQRGITTMRKNDVKSSYQDFVQATKLNDKEPAFFGNRAYAARLLAQYDDAVTSYGKALVLGGANHVYYNGAGLSLMGLKKYENSQKAFSLAIKTYKQVAKTDNWMYFRNFGIALHLAKDYKTAYAAFSKAIELNSKNADLYIRRGNVAKDFGRTDLANKDYETAARLDPKSSGSQTASLPANSDARLLGSWLCVGVYKGANKRIGAAFTEDGFFAMHFISTVNGRQSVTKLSGKFSADNGKILLTTKTGKVESYRYGFQNGRLWIDVKGTGVAMYFDRKS